MEAVRRLLPELTNTLRKGNCGRLGVVGGSAEYTGAPYYAAVSMLKVGADLSHVFTAPEAAAVIKSYSPELIVHPYLEPGDWLERLDGLLVGPGLGREEASLTIARDCIARAQRLARPLVIDADGLWAFTECWEMLADPPIHSPSLPLILTPNAVEMDRLAQKVLGKRTLNRNWQETREVSSKLAARLQMHIFVKGTVDMFAMPDGRVRLFDATGAPRRPGGLGDCLAGLLLTFLHWSHRAGEPMELAAEAASFFARDCTRAAFEDVGRGMTASDVIAQVSALVKQIDNGADEDDDNDN